MEQYVLEEANELLQIQPLLSLENRALGVTITGNYKLHCQYNGEVFTEYFALQIFVPDGYPRQTPTVKSTDKKIRSSNYKEHVYSDGQFCLELDTVIRIFLSETPSLLCFVTRFIDSFLFGFLYYQKYRKMPFGERAHGANGILEFYCDLFLIENKKAALKLLELISRENIKGHRECPCNSGKRYRDCHRSQISSLRASEEYSSYVLDFNVAINELA